MSCSKAKLARVVAAVGMGFLLALSSVSYAGMTTYKYDTLGRVIEVDYPDGSVVIYTYDKAGNRTATTRTAGP